MQCVGIHVCISLVTSLHVHYTTQCMSLLISLLHNYICYMLVFEHHYVFDLENLCFPFAVKIIKLVIT